MQRKKILILGHNDATQFIDIFNQYTRLFDKNKYEVTVAYLSGAPNVKTRERTLAENIIFLNLSKKKLRMLKIHAIKQLYNLCKQKHFEIVICHRYKPTYIMMCVAQLIKFPALICVMHELATMSSISRKIFLRLMTRRNMLFAGVSNAVRDDMRKDLSFLPQEQIITLYNMIDIELSEPQLLSREDAREALQLDATSFVFATIGRLAKNKDHESLIRAFAQVKTKMQDAKLIIIGDGRLELKLKELVNSFGLTNDVIFSGFVAHGFKYMKAFDCFVLSSIQEAFGRVLLEAMMAQIPIIATKINGIPEVLGNVGRLVAPKDISSLANAMQDIYAAAYPLDSVKEAYHHVVANYSIPKFHEQFWRLPLMLSVITR